MNQVHPAVKTSQCVKSGEQALWPTPAIPALRRQKQEVQHTHEVFHSCVARPRLKKQKQRVKSELILAAGVTVLAPDWTVFRTVLLRQSARAFPSLWSSACPCASMWG